MSTGARYLAEVRCVHCARMVGAWEWASEAPAGHGIFKRPDGSERAGVAWRLRCTECGGPVYLEDERRLRNDDLACRGPMRPGRKPKRRVA